MQRHTVFRDWKINIIKMFRLPKPIYRFNTTSIKITVAVFITLKSKSSSHMELQNTKSQRTKHEVLYYEFKNSTQS